MWGRRQLDTEAGERRLEKPPAGPDGQGARHVQGDMSGCADRRLEDEQCGAKPDAANVLLLRLAVHLLPVCVVERRSAIVISLLRQDFNADGLSRQDALTFFSNE